MRGTAFNQPTDWLEFDAQGEPQDEGYEGWRIHVQFIMSSWECLYGRGCPGHFGVGESSTKPDIGCCSHGAWITDSTDYNNVRANIAKLTPEDWDEANRKALGDQDPIIIFKKQDELVEQHKSGDDEEDVVLVEEDYSMKTRVWEGGCVFANRNGGSTGKPGCAFLHMAMRTSAEGEKVSHTETMPNVCWMLPLRNKEVDDVQTIQPWDAQEWGGEDDDDTHDSWMSWWCTDTPDAYLVGRNPLYVTMKEELIRVMGQKNYDYMVKLLKEREKEYGWAVNKPAMPVLVEQGERPSLSFYVGNRKPVRPGQLTSP